jgi:hypothetical protein
MKDKSVPISSGDARTSLVKQAIDAQANKAKRCIAFPFIVEIHCKTLSFLAHYQASPL